MIQMLKKYNKQRHIQAILLLINNGNNYQGV